MAHLAFRVNLILVMTLIDYRGPIYMGSNVTLWVLHSCYLNRLYKKPCTRNLIADTKHYSHIPNSSIGRNNSIGWKTTKI